MRPVPVILVAVCAMMLVAPVTTAKWSAMGGIEPDNKYEGDGKFNWADKPGAITNRVYFQVFTTESGANPNVGAEGILETHNEPATIENVYALLGVWRDCNGDGYIGLAESAALEYPASLLPPGSPCPAFSGTQNQFAQRGYPSNYNGWVTEFIHIGGSGDGGVEDEDEDGTPDNVEDDLNDQRILRDGTAKVWGDFGLPNDSADAAGGTCALTPIPRGTTASTGGAINYVDCLTGLLELYNSVFLGRTVARQHVPGIDESNSLGLVFVNDDDATQGGHPLHVGTFGSEDSSGSAVRGVQDCNARIVRSSDVVNATPIEPTLQGLLNDPGFTLGAVNNVELYNVNPSFNLNPATWTVPGQLNQTNEEFDNCDTTDDRGDDFYGVIEGDFAGTAQGDTGKEQAEWNFGFRDFARGQGANVALASGNSGASSFAGAFRLVGTVFFAGSIWDGGENLVKAGQQTVRASVVNGTVQPDTPWIETYYAFVGGNVTSKGFVTPGTGGTYGSAQCGSFTSGIHNGWECDPTKWYRNPDGTLMPEPTASAGFARVGQPYQLRDIDCYDGNTNLGIPLGVPALGVDRCN